MVGAWEMNMISINQWMVMMMKNERGPTGAFFEESRIWNLTRGVRKYFFSGCFWNAKLLRSSWSRRVNVGKTYRYF